MVSQRNDNIYCVLFDRSNLMQLPALFFFFDYSKMRIYAEVAHKLIWYHKGCTRCLLFLQENKLLFLIFEYIYLVWRIHAYWQTCCMRPVGGGQHSGKRVWQNAFCLKNTRICPLKTNSSQSFIVKISKELFSSTGD